MLRYDYGCTEKEGEKFPVKDFSLSELGITVNDPIPDSITIDGKVWKKLRNTTALFFRENKPSKQILVNSLEYFSAMGELPLKEVWVDNKKYLFDRVVDGIPNFADFTDTFRRMHDDSYHVKFTKPPLECESSTWGYGLT